MSLTTAEIRALTADLAPRLEGGRIERIDQPGPRKVVLTVRNGPALYWLLLCADPRFSRFHLLPQRPEQGPPAAGFCNAVRQHLTGAPLEALRQVPDDRVVVIETRERDELMHPHRVSLVAELIGVGSNLLLLDESERVLAALDSEDSPRRQVYPGALYNAPEPPETVPERARRNRFAEAADSDDPLALSRAVAAHYRALETGEELESLREELAGVLDRALKARRRRLRKVSEQLQRAGRAEEWKRKGELLKLALHQVSKGQTEVVVEDLFDPGRREVTIELDPSLSPTENLQRLFNRYKKATNSRETLEERLEATSDGLAGLEDLREQVEAAASADRLRELKSAVKQAGVLFPEDRRRRRRAGAARGPRRFQSVDGLEILVARNQKENDRLTFTIARGNDYWLHVRGWPGPHVVLRVPPDREPSRGALVDAAHLALHYSSIRGTDYGEVTYTRCKNVRRLKAAPPGKVSYADASTLAVRIQPRRIRRLLDTRPAEEEAG